MTTLEGALRQSSRSSPIYLTIPVARTGHLIALKVLSRDDVDRPQDLVDLRALLRSASPPDLAQAREGIALIVARGYHRGRDLVSAFATLVGAGRPPEE